MVVSLQELAENAVHFGHKTSRWNPKMKKYIYGSVKGIHVFDLNKTADQLKKVIVKVEDLAKKGKTILFVSTKPQTKALLEEFQESTGYPIVTNKWVGGMMTNFETIKGRIKKMKDYENMIESGEIEKYTKKEISKIEKELAKLQEAFSGIRDMFKAPDAIFIVDGKRDLNALLEAKRLKIPVYGIADTNVDPDNYDIIIPANDDAISSLALILSYVFEAAKNNPRLARQAEKKA